MKNIYYILTIVFAVILNGEEKYNNSIPHYVWDSDSSNVGQTEFGFKIGRIIQDYSLNLSEILLQQKNIHMPKQISKMIIRTPVNTKSLITYNYQEILNGLSLKIGLKITLIRSNGMLIEIKIGLILIKPYQVKPKSHKISFI